MKKIFSFVSALLLFVIVTSNLSIAKPRLHSFFLFKQYSLNKVLHQLPHQFWPLLDTTNIYRTNIFITTIKHRKNGKIKLTHYAYNKNSNAYFYSASLIKLPLIIATLNKIDEINSTIKDSLLRIKLIDSLWVMDKNYCGLQQSDETKNGMPISYYLKQMIIVSNNRSFNPLYDFVTPNYLNRHLADLGYESINCNQRFHYACNEAQNKVCQAVAIKSNGIIKYYQDSMPNQTLPQSPLPWAIAGQAYMNSNDSLIQKPLTFEGKNYISLADMNGIMNQLFFCKENKKSNLITNKLFRDSLITWMGMYPYESVAPQLDNKKYTNTIGKYFYYGDSTWTQLPQEIRIYNKVGQAYGFMSDCAYLVDRKNKKEIIVTAGVYLNKDGVLNDDKYEYKTIGYPFFKTLGQLLLSN
jgi:hypothetical protein